MMFTMGGYAVYVWSAYGLVLSVFILNGFSVRRQKRRLQQALSRVVNHASSSQA
jgi:heme exporter protein CcmD